MIENYVQERPAGVRHVVAQPGPRARRLRPRHLRRRGPGVPRRRRADHRQREDARPRASARAASPAASRCRTWPPPGGSTASPASPSASPCSTSSGPARSARSSTRSSPPRPSPSPGRKGYLDGQALAGVFAWLRPNDLVWNYWVNNYLLGKKPPAFDVLFWNADTTRMPAGLHRDFLTMSIENALVDAGQGAGARDAGRPVQGRRRQLRRGGRRRPHLPLAELLPQHRPARRHLALRARRPAATSRRWSTRPATRRRASPSTTPAPRTRRSGSARPTPSPGTWWTDHVAWLAERSRRATCPRRPSSAAAACAPSTPPPGPTCWSARRLSRRCGPRPHGRRAAGRSPGRPGG